MSISDDEWTYCSDAGWEISTCTNTAQEGKPDELSREISDDSSLHGLG